MADDVLYVREEFAPPGVGVRVWITRHPSGGLTVHRRGPVPLIRTDYAALPRTGQWREVPDTPEHRAAGAVPLADTLSK